MSSHVHCQAGCSLVHSFRMRARQHASCRMVRQSRASRTRSSAVQSWHVFVAARVRFQLLCAGFMLANGHGVDQDQRAAMEWYQKVRLRACSCPDSAALFFCFAQIKHSLIAHFSRLLANPGCGPGFRARAEQMRRDDRDRAGLQQRPRACCLLLPASGREEL